VRDVHGSGYHEDAAGGVWDIASAVERVDEHDVPRATRDESGFQVWCEHTVMSVYDGTIKSCMFRPHSDGDHLSIDGWSWGPNRPLQYHKEDRNDVWPTKTAEPAAMEESGENPKQAAGEQKPQIHLVPPAFIVEVAKAMAEGVPRYGAWNFRDTKIRTTTYVSAAMRHLLAYLDGEDVDPESAVGKKHLAGAAAALAILIDAETRGFVNDDRPKVGGAAPEMLRAPGFRK
jgi:hypothetical protein